jgi:hypothetical protein
MVKYLASPTTTTDLINLKNATISFITAIGVAIIVALTKKVYEIIKKTCASKAIEENVFLENIHQLILHIHLHIQQQIYQPMILNRS